MPTVTAVVADGRVLVTIDGLPVVANPLPATPWTLYRTDGATERPVRGAVGRPLTTSAGTVVVDTEYPLVRPFTYVLRYDTTAGPVAVSSAWVNVPADLPLLSHPVTGDAVPVTVRAWPSRSRAARSSALSVDGRRSPYVVVGRMAAPEGTITLSTLTEAHRVALWDLLDSGETLLLRAIDAGVPETYLVPSSVSELRITNRAADVRRTWELSVTETDMPDPAVESRGVTLADLAEVFFEQPLSALDVVYPTLLALAQDPL